MVTASCQAARELRALTMGHAVRLLQEAVRRASVKGITGGLDAYWMAARRNLDRARLRLLFPF